MLWGWIVRTIAGCPARTGLFSFLAIRDRNRCQIKLERARQDAFKDLITALPCGAVYREVSGDSRREIWMPPALRSRLFVLPVLHHESVCRPCDPTELVRPKRTLNQDQPHQVDD
jgi:hypothetical protein